MSEINLNNDNIIREREIKYLVHGKTSLDEILKALLCDGFEIANPPRVKHKDEIYYDDKNYTILNRGDVLRESNHRVDNKHIHEFMYKMQNSNAEKPYVEKIEIRAKLNTIDEFKALFGSEIPQDIKPVLRASMERNFATVKKADLLIIITLDKTKYTKGEQSFTELMVEFEDISDIESDSQFDYIDKLVQQSRLPLELTKQSKYERGYLNFNRNS